MITEQTTTQTVSVTIISGWTDFSSDGQPKDTEATYKVKAAGFHHVRLPVLLEAAPDLLEAVQAALECDDRGSDLESWARMRDLCERALFKATGERRSI